MQKCDHDLELIDESFDHEYGTEYIQYMQCTKCDATNEDDPKIPSPDDYFDDQDL